MSYDVDIAQQVEAHEARAWAACVEAAAAAPGNPLAASVDRSSGVAAPALAALNVGLFNRVIGLGVPEATVETVDGILASYADRGQTNFVVEVAPVAVPPELTTTLAERGLVDGGYRQAKTWRRPAPDDTPAAGEVVMLGPNDADAFARVNCAAWQVPEFLGAWFGATFGVDGFTHYGVKLDGLVVSTGAMFVSDGLAWLGFGATLPDHRGRGMQTAVLARRVDEAARLGCTLVHSETAAHTADNHNHSLANMISVGFDHGYDKQWWVPAPPTPTQ